MKRLLSLLTVLSLGSAVQAQEGIVLQAYDLRPFDMEMDGDYAHDAVLWVADSRNDRHRLYYEQEGETSGSEYAINVLEQALGSLLDGDGVNLQMRQNGTLVVAGSASLQVRVRETLDQIYAITSAAYEVQVDLVRWEGVPQAGGLPGSNLSAVTADAFLSKAEKNGARMSRSVGRASPGKTLRMDNTHMRSYLADYDVEIAMAAAIADPVVAYMQLGESVSLRCDPGPGGVALCLLCESFELLEMHQTPVKIGVNVSTVTQPTQGSPFILGGTNFGLSAAKEGSPTFIETPRVLQRSFGAETFVPDGQVLCFSTTVEVAGVAQTQVLMVRVNGGSDSVRDWVKLPAEGAANLLAINLHGLVPPSMNFEVLRDLANHRYARHGLRTMFRGGAYEWAVERISDSVGRVHWEGSWVFAHVDPNWDSQSGQRLAAIKGMVSERPLRELQLSAGGSLGRIESRLPVLANGDFGVAIGLVEATVYDYDVEVAQGSSVGDPAVGHDFSGLILAGSLSGSDLRTNGLVEWSERSGRSMEINGGNMGPITGGTTVSRTLDGRSRVEAGKPLIFGDPKGGGAHAGIIVR